MNVSIEEFAYLNKKYKIMDENLLNDILKAKQLRFYTNEIINQNKYGLIFFNTEKFHSALDITFTKHDFSIEDFNNIKEMFKNQYIGFFMTDLTTEQREILEIMVHSSSRFNKISKNFDEYMNFLIENQKKEINIDYYEDLDKRTIKKFFNIEKDIKYQLIYDSNDYYNYIYHILEVKEYRVNNKNYRMVLCEEIKVNGKNDCNIKIVSETDEDYNYMDKNRMFIEIDNRTTYIDIGLNEYNTDGEMLIYFELFKLLKKHINRYYTKTINPNVYRFYKDKISTIEKLNLKEEINKQYIALLEQEKTIKVNDVFISPNSIVLDSFRIDFDKDFINVVELFDDIKRLIKSDIRFNFNEFYEKLLRLSRLKNIDRASGWTFTGIVSFSVNNIPISIVKRKDRLYINDIFSRHEDAFDILNRAICYHDIKDFNRFIKDTSFIGFVWKKFISNGKIVKLTNEFKDVLPNLSIPSHLMARLSFLRHEKRRTHIYMVVNDIKFLIKYRGKFKQHFQYPEITMRIGEFYKNLSECFDDFNYETFITIIDNAIIESEIIRKRGEELVKNTINDTKAEDTYIELNGNVLYGYKVNGIKGGKYFIEKYQLTVYKFMNGQWNRRCVIDDSSKSRIFEDRVANRLANIYNEPSYISTIHG